MSRIRVSGTSAVCAMLRQMADDLSGQPPSLAGVTMAGHPEVTAVAEVTPGEATGRPVVSLRITVGLEHRDPLPVEQELTHPGG